MNLLPYRQPVALLTYTPPERRVRVFHHRPPETGPVWKITTQPPKGRRKKWESVIRVQIDIPQRAGVAITAATYVVIDWSEGDAEAGIRAAAGVCWDLYIDHSIEEDPELNPPF